MKHESLKVIDSHTGGETTRIVIEGGPDLGGGSVADKAKRLTAEHGWLRRSLCNEPRGHDGMVGGLLCESSVEGCVAGVIFFNDLKTLGMCVHGMIGLAVTLAHMGRIQIGEHKVETPVGVVSVVLNEDGSVEVANVPSYRTQKDVEVEIPEWGLIRGDIAWGGNWFYLINRQGPEVKLENLAELLLFSNLVRDALAERGIRGDVGEAVDHIEVFGPPIDPAVADSQNFVLCSGSAHDRSPCGTGTSAKLACLVADGKLADKKIWRQAGILGSVFHGSAQAQPDGKILPRITGRAWVNGEAIYYFQANDPFRHGIS